MSPASGDKGRQKAIYCKHKDVSIQLMSPASGDYTTDVFLDGKNVGSFHSINVPSEWGQHEVFLAIFNTFEFPFN